MSAGRRPVVVLGSTRWDQRVPLGDWQLARAFRSLGHEVVWVDPPRSFVKRQSKRSAESQGPRDSAVRVVRPVVLRGSRRWWLESVQDLMYEQQVRVALQRTGPAPLVLVATPAHGPLRRLARKYQVVYWQKDRQWANPQLPDAKWLRRRHEDLLRTAAVVSAVSPQIVEDNRELGVEAVLIPNGVDVEHWSTPVPEPADLSAVSHPRAIFLGAWGWRVDAALVAEVARRLPNLQFVVVGQVTAPTPTRPNVHVLGAKGYDALPGYAQHADVGLVPYTAVAFNASSNPLKVLEYSAAGLPVVTQGVSVPFGLPHVIDRSGPDEWSRALEAVIGGRANARPVDLPAVAEHDWRQRARAVLRETGTPVTG